MFIQRKCCVQRKRVDVDNVCAEKKAGVPIVSYGKTKGGKTFIFSHFFTLLALCTRKFLCESCVFFTPYHL